MTKYNRAGALIHIYPDGSLQVNHGGTEMGQGLFTKVAQVVAQVLGIGLDRIRPMATSTAKVPNTSATAASSGTDLNGMAAFDAAHTLKKRLSEYVRTLWALDTQANLEFSDDAIHGPDGQRLDFTHAVQQALDARINLSASGFYATPDIHWDRSKGHGQPFYYYACGVAQSEALIDTLTGEYKLLATHILHDTGASLNPALDIGQIEGAFVQGVGWLTSEELKWNDHGALATHAPSTYKIPTARERPMVFTVDLYGKPNPKATIYRSKAVGEPPLMLAFAAFMAIKDAVSAAKGAGPVILDAPATPEAVLRAMG